MAEELVEVEVLQGKDHMGPDGNVIGGGGVYTTSKSQAKALADRGLVKIVGAAPQPVVVAGGETSAKEDRWTLKITPQEFVARFPDATNANAQLARRLIEAGRGDEGAGNAAEVDAALGPSEG